MQPYEVELSPKVTETLIAMVELTKANQVMTLTCYKVSSIGSTALHLSIFAGEQTREIETIEDPYPALDALGLVRFYPSRPGSSDSVILTKAGYDWAEYHKKGKFARWVYRLLDSGKSSALVLVSLVAFILSVLQVLQAVGIL